MTDTGGCRLKCAGRSGASAAQPNAATPSPATVAKILPNFLVMLSPVIGYPALLRTSQLSREPASHLETLLIAHVTSHFDLAAVRAQREMRPLSLANDLRPVTVQFEVRDSTALADFNCHAVAFYRDALVIAGMAVDITKRNIQHGHLDSGEWHDRPCPEPKREHGSNAKRDGQNEREDEP